jgi:hypothetical protein
MYPLGAACQIAFYCWIVHSLLYIYIYIIPIQNNKLHNFALNWSFRAIERKYTTYQMEPQQNEQKTINSNH